MITGIDVSHWQGEIDWDAVAAAKCRFVFMKATEGATWTDASFARNRAECRRLGIPCGAYHYIRSTSAVKDQVQNFLQVVGSLQKGELPPVLDFEDPGQWKGKTRAELTELCLEWLKAVEEALDTRPLIYLSASVANQLLDTGDERLLWYPLWVAHWTEKEPTVPPPWNRWTFWQYSSKGCMPGITANVVDLDRFFGDEDEFEVLLT